HGLLVAVRVREHVGEQRARPVDRVGALRRLALPSLDRLKRRRVYLFRVRHRARVVVLLYVSVGEQSVHAVDVRGDARLGAEVVGERALGLFGARELRALLYGDEARALLEVGQRAPTLRGSGASSRTRP